MQLLGRNSPINVFYIRSSIFTFSFAYLIPCIFGPISLEILLLQSKTELVGRMKENCKLLRVLLLNFQRTRKEQLVHWESLSRKVVDAPFLEVFKARLDEPLSSLV